MPQNDFLPFALAGNANVTTQAAYLALGARSSGFQSGVAQSDQVNKVLRQAAFITAMVAQFTTDQSGFPVLDNGDLAGAEASFLAALTHVIQLQMTAGGFAYANNLAAEIAARIQADVNEANERARVDGNEAAIRAAADQSETSYRTQDVATLYTNYQAADQNLLNNFALYAPISSFASAAGYQWTQGGTLIQYGNGVTTTGNQDYQAFPVAFPNAVTAIVAVENAASGWSSPPSPTIFGTTKLNNSAFHVSVAVINGVSPPFFSAGKGYSFIAIGR